MPKAVSGPQRPAPAPILANTGDTGLKVFGDGRIREEFHRSLLGDRWIKTIVKEILYNEPYLAAPYWLMESMAKSTNRTVKMAPKVDGVQHPQSAEAQEYIDSAINDMESTMDDVIGEAMTAVPYGFSYLEILYKLRKGHSPEPRLNSKHNDGRYGWRDWSPRAQDSREQWAFTDEGRLLGMWQRVDRKPGQLFVPLTKVPGIGGALHFRFRGSKQNPEGFSFFRPAYVPYYFAKNLRQIEAIALERDGAGLPVMEVPAEILNAGAGTAEATALAKYVDMVRKMKFDKQGGVVIPGEFTSEGAQSGYRFTLMSASGKNIQSFREAIKSNEIAMLTVPLTQFLSFGVTDTGSRSLGDSMTSNLGYATSAVNKSIDETITRQAIPGLMRLERFHPDAWPSMFSADVEKQKLSDSGNFLNQMITGGVIRSTKKVEDYALRQLDMDPEEDIGFEDGVIEDDPIGDPTETLAERGDDTDDVDLSTYKKDDDGQLELPIDDAVPAPHPMMDVGEAAEFLGVSRQRIRSAHKKGQLKGVPIGNTIKFKRAALEALVDGE